MKAQGDNENEEEEKIQPKSARRNDGQANQPAAQSNAPTLESGLR